MSSSAKLNRTDREELESALQGDCLALDRLFSKYRSFLHTIAYRVLGNRDEAEDAVQNGMLTAFSKLSDLQCKEAFRSWLARVVMNEAIALYRKRKALASRNLTSTPNDEVEDLDRFSSKTPDPEQVLVEKEYAALLKGEISRLSPAQRFALALSQQEMSTEEISNLLSVSEGAVRCRLFRARKQLADNLELAIRPER